MAKIVIKTPTRSWTARQGVLYGDIFEKQIERNASKIVLNHLAEINKSGSNYKAVIDQRLQIFAVFFQRVVSRTPLDEKYTWTEINPKTGNEVKHTHKPDKGVHSAVRYDWFITDGEKTVSAQDFPKKYFEVVNDKAAIEAIFKKFKSSFAPRLAKSNASTALETLELLNIKNDNPHFEAVEYGTGHNWTMTSQIKDGPKYPHGLENKHPVFAPAGMYRITEMELQRESMRNSRTNLTKRYKANGKTKRSQLARVPSDKDLDDFWKLMKKKKINYSDIKRYIGAR